MTYVTLGLLIVCALTAAYFIWAIRSRIRLSDSMYSSLKSDIAKLTEDYTTLRDCCKGQNEVYQSMVDCLTEFNSRMDASKHALGYHYHNALPDPSWRRRVTQVQITNHGYSIFHPVFPGLAYVSDVIRTAGGGRARGEGAPLVAYPDKHLRDSLPCVGLHHAHST